MQSWESQGMKNPIPRIRTLDGFNEDWIDFERGEVGLRKGSVALETDLKSLIARAYKSISTCRPSLLPHH